MQRRQLLRSLSVGAALAPVAAQVAAAGVPGQRPRRLQPGDTIGLVSPSAAIYQREPFDIAIDSLKAMGFKVKEGQFLRARNGHFAGTDAQRSQDLNAMFADNSVQGILAMGGGSGATRLLHLLDYALIRRQPKFLAGYSDVTALLNAVQARTGLVCFHSPMGSSDWNAFSTTQFRSVVMEAKPALLANPTDLNSVGVPVTGRTHAIRGGTASGRLVGGNLTVLTTLLGTPYAPDFRGAILFLEDINEYIYRIDRMLSHLKQAGAFQGLAGVVLGQFTDCKPGDDYGTLPLDDVFDDYFGALNIPVFSGSMFGHVRQKFTLPVGLEVEMVAEAGTLRLLSPAVV